MPSGVDYRVNQPVAKYAEQASGGKPNGAGTGCGADPVGQNASRRGDQA